MALESLGEEQGDAAGRLSASGRRSPRGLKLAPAPVKLTNDERQASQTTTAHDAARAAATPVARARRLARLLRLARRDEHTGALRRSIRRNRARPRLVGLSSKCATHRPRAWRRHSRPHTARTPRRDPHSCSQQHARLCERQAVVAPTRRDARARGQSPTSKSRPSLKTRTRVRVSQKRLACPRIRAHLKSQVRAARAFVRCGGFRLPRVRGEQSNVNTQPSVESFLLNAER